MSGILAGKPQKRVDIGMSKPIFISRNQVDDEIRDKFNEWIHKVGRGYKRLLNKYNLGESLFFIGKKNVE